MQRRAVLLALAGAIPAGILGLLSFINLVPMFSDPCLHWATEQHGSDHGVRGRSGKFSASLPSSADSITENPCANRTSFTSDTKLQFVTRLILVQGGLLIGCILGVFGAVSSNPLVTVIGSIVLLLESIPLLTLAPLTLFGGILLLLSALRIYSGRRNSG